VVVVDANHLIHLISGSQGHTGPLVEFWGWSWTGKGSHAAVLVNAMANWDGELGWRIGMANWDGELGWRLGRGRGSDSIHQSWRQADPERVRSDTNGPRGPGMPTGLAI
jgi:hypothetical protein